MLRACRDPQLLTLTSDVSGAHLTCVTRNWKGKKKFKDIDCSICCFLCCRFSCLGVTDGLTEALNAVGCSTWTPCSPECVLGGSRLLPHSSNSHFLWVLSICPSIRSCS